MTTIYLLLLLAAILCFLAAAFRGGTDGVGRVRVNLIALGLAFWVAVPLLQTIRGIGD